MPTVYYIRHGETDWNVERRLQGCKDIPLNARGIAQATRCGQLLRGILAEQGRDPARLDFVSSPLQRAQRTMQLAREAMQLDAMDYRIMPELTEISFGDWEGFTLDELRRRDPQRVALREHDKYRFLPPGGESYEMIAARMDGWYRALTGDTVVVAHGGTARGLMASLGVIAAAAAPLADIDQGVVYVFAGGKVSRHG